MGRMADAIYFTITHYKRLGASIVTISISYGVRNVYRFESWQMTHNTIFNVIFVTSLALWCFWRSDKSIRALREY